jgi:hypothetical protein
MMKVQSQQRVSIYTIAVFLLLALVALSSNNQQGNTFFVSAQDDAKEDKEDKVDDEDDDADDEDVGEPVTIMEPPGGDMMTPMEPPGGDMMTPGGNITSSMPDMGMDTDMGMDNNNTMMDPDEECTCDMDNMISCSDPKDESMCMCDMDGQVVCDDSDEPPKKDEEPDMAVPVDMTDAPVPADTPLMDDTPAATPVIVSPTPAAMDDTNSTVGVGEVSGSAKTNVAVVVVAISALAGLVALN